MSIRLPLQAVLQSTNSTETGVNSIFGVLAIPFTIPQDTDNVVVKFACSIVGGGMSAQLQTTDDGGNTWYGVARTSVVTNASGDAVQWLSVPVCGYGTRGSSVVSVGSVTSGGVIGNSQPSTLSTIGGYTGMPILSPTARIALQIVGGTTTAASNNVVTTVYANSQSARQ